MPKKTTTSKQKSTKQKAALKRLAEAGGNEGDGGALKPTESAENFEHVIRRLVIARDKEKRASN